MVGSFVADAVVAVFFAASDVDLRGAEVDDRLVEIGDTGTVELVAEAIPGPFLRGVQLAPVEENDVLVAAQAEAHAAFEDLV